MPRPQRQFEIGALYHVFTRGSNRQAVFRYDTDRVDFLECLDRVVDRHDLELLEYCLMPNHVHFLVRANEHLSNAMKALLGRYSLRFNRRFDRDAHLFRNRFRAVLQVTDEQLVTTIGYIAANPVEAEICATAAEYPWSSHRALIGLEAQPRFLAVDQLLALLGPDHAAGRRSYQQVVEARLNVGV